MQAEALMDSSGWLHRTRAAASPARLNCYPSVKESLPTMCKRDFCGGSKFSQSGQVRWVVPGTEWRRPLVGVRM